MLLPIQQWLDIIRKEYLQDFIRHGGAAVKFVVPVEMTTQGKLLKDLEDMAKESGFLFVSVDSAQTKIHMMDKLFHEIAKNIDWDDLNYRFLCRILTENETTRYNIPTGRDDFSISKIAKLNERDASELRGDIHSLIRRQIFRDYAMSQEFRIAMIRLCRAILDPDDIELSTSAQSIKEWLIGELRLISALKTALIFQKIARHNSRHMLYSLAHWLKMAGQLGLVLCLDISRYLSSTRPVDPGEGNYYSSAAVLDAYEVLRQFVDGTDELDSTLIIVIAPSQFLADDRRGVNRYDALKLRIWDDVRDKRKANPFSSLIRLCQECSDELTIKN